MARRTNLEVDLLANPRFQALVRFLGGDLQKALGRVLCFWMGAQRHWEDNEKLMPADEFKIGEFEGLLEVGLAEKRKGGIYARGAAKHFGWCVKRDQQQKQDAEAEVPQQKRAEAAPAAGSGGRKQSKPAAPSPLDLAAVWNAAKSPAMSAVDIGRLRAGSPRWRAAQARLSEEPDLAYWKTTAETIAASSFCNGNNSRSWIAGFDFFLRPETHIKVAEGQYASAPLERRMVVGGTCEPQDPPGMINLRYMTPEQIAKVLDD